MLINFSQKVMHKLYNFFRISSIQILILFLFSISYLLLPSIALAGDHTYYIHTDHLGSVVAVTDETGNSSQQTSYTPYGKETTLSSQSKPIERGYTGQIKDQNTTLNYYNARYYDPILSRFISADSVQGGNRFAYVGGNPISHGDPSGNMKTESEVYYPNYKFTIDLNTLANKSPSSNRTELINKGYDPLWDGFFPGNVGLKSRSGQVVAQTVSISDKFQNLINESESRMPPMIQNTDFFLVLRETDMPGIAGMANTDQSSKFVALSQYLYQMPNEAVIQTILHEMTHNSENKTTDYLTRNGPLMIGKEEEFPQGTQISIVDTVDYLMLDVLDAQQIYTPDNPRASGLSEHGKPSDLPKDAYGFTNMDEFVAESYSGYLEPKGYEQFNRYTFPWQDKRYQSLKKFYQYLDTLPR